MLYICYITLSFMLYKFCQNFYNTIVSILLSKTLGPREQKPPAGGWPSRLRLPSWLSCSPSLWLWPRVLERDWLTVWFCSFCLSLFFSLRCSRPTCLFHTFRPKDGTWAEKLVKRLSEDRSSCEDVQGWLLAPLLCSIALRNHLCHPLATPFSQVFPVSGSNLCPLWLSGAI